MSCATLNAYALHQLACERCMVTLCLPVDCVAGIVSVGGLVCLCECVCMLSSCDQVLCPNAQLHTVRALCRLTLCVYTPPILFYIVYSRSITCVVPYFCCFIIIYNIYFFIFIYISKEQF
jgi:hypothetical protein